VKCFKSAFKANAFSQHGLALPRVIFLNANWGWLFKFSVFRIFLEPFPSLWVYLK